MRCQSEHGDDGLYSWLAGWLYLLYAVLQAWLYRTNLSSCAGLGAG